MYVKEKNQLIKRYIFIMAAILLVVKIGFLTRYWYNYNTTT